MQRKDDDNDINEPSQNADDTVAQRQVDFVVADGLAVVLLHEDGITNLLPNGVKGSVDIAKHEEQADNEQNPVERHPECVGTAVVDKLNEILVVDVVVQVLEVEHIEGQMEAERN